MTDQECCKRLEAKTAEADGYIKALRDIQARYESLVGMFRPSKIVHEMYVIARSATIELDGWQ